MGRLKIGVIGIPIILEKNKGLIKESFMPKMTGGLRAEIINFILTNCKENGINVDIRDLKELFDASNYSCLKKDNLIGITKISLDKLAEEFKKRINGFDFVILIGGIHTGAYLLYHFPENVERYDIHEDNNDIELVFHTSYMKHVVELNNSPHISNHGWEDLLDEIFNIKTKENLGKIFDIDIDYYTSTEYCKMTEERMDKNFQNIISDVRKAKPKILGIFEYQTLDKSQVGYKKLQDLIWEGILSNVR